MQLPRVSGTVSAHLARSLVGATTSRTKNRLARLPDLTTEVLADDLARISTPSLIRVWESLVLTEPRTTIGTRILEEAPIGTFGTWDYLITTGPCLRESLTQAVNLIAAIGDPAAEKLIVEEDGRHFTVRHATGTWGPDVVQAVDIFALSLFLTRARAATGLNIIPSRVTITHQAPRQVRPMARFFGADQLHFDAPYNSISFREEDVRRPLPKAQPGMDRILAHHAELLLASSRSVLQWHDRFRMMLTTAFKQQNVTLEYVAARLSMSPRTIQRRLAGHGTTWSAEVEAVRHERTMDLLHTTDAPFTSIARQVGYSDVRALRRAVLRWEGRTPREVRMAAASRASP
ncbi:AraC family transcriptional regulator ligand-binding domain-containing protein [Streptomyces sp. NPDC059556]|uniref:AraC family transcriptional regulator n=1 Tax=Streptomyces sp. NPDC059556 TaxID=3346863 RepID=UPI003689105E